MLYRLFVLLIASISLTACGKKGAPNAPNGSDGGCYPSSYPSAELAPLT